MTVQEAYRQLVVSLQTIYEPREASNIAGMVTEHITGFTNSSRIIHKQDVIDKNTEERFRQIHADLLTHKPLQYVLQEAHFYGMKLYVNEHVLIPRPETEELVEWVISDVRSTMCDVRCNLLDIGTGSGCIPVAIKKNLPDVNMYAADISEDALQVAKKNAEDQNTNVHFLITDILNENQWTSFPLFKYIITNPPYITQSEASFMNDNVVSYEPHLALFIPDNDPLLFYDAISSFGLQHLENNGKLFFEINEVFGNEIVALLAQKGYVNIELRKDLQGKDRMIKAEAAAP